MNVLATTFSNASFRLAKAGAMTLSKHGACWSYVGFFGRRGAVGKTPWSAVGRPVDGFIVGVKGTGDGN